MCGVAGYLGFDGTPASPLVLKSMAEAIAHRGPDDEGIFTDGPAGLAHRRLSIIDLTSAGHQPMTSRDGRYVISYNGELYNFQELRTELEALGHRFHTRTDTEVLLQALAQWGTEALGRFNGIFAFALWDKRDKKLLLARDRFGVKPMYVASSGQGIVFGSEIKALLKHPAVKASIDYSGLAQYLTFQNFLTDQTLFDGVELLPAGSYLEVDAQGRRRQVQYWDYNFSEVGNGSRSRLDLREELLHLLERAVSRQMVSDAPLGSYLSGGMDSGSVTALASRQVENLKTFVVGFDLHSASGLELGFDERVMSELMSYKFQTEHYEMVLKAGDMERCMRNLVWHLEEPRVGQSYPNFYAAKLASKFGRVVLSGTGGDEMFGGYPWRYYRAVVNDNFDQYIDKYYGFWQRLVSESDLPKIMNPVWGEVGQTDPKEVFRNVFSHHSDELNTPADYVNHSLYFEAKTFLHGLLVVEDKLSMAHSLESRVPFLDYDLVDFAMGLPVSEKLQNLDEVVRINENEPGRKTRQYFEKTRDGKLILRDVMNEILPTNISSATKQGFSAPDESWFRGESIDYVRDLLYAPNARIFDILDKKETLSLVNEHLDGKSNRRLLIWSLLYLEIWLDTFL